MDEPLPPSGAPLALLAGWLLSLAAATAASGAAAFFAGVFLKPHAFGGRDGQSGAGLAALFILVGAGAALVSLPIAVAFGARLRRHGLRAPLWASLLVPLLAAAGMLLFGRLA